MNQYLLKGIRKLEGQKRSALTIQIGILKMAREGVRKTPIVYELNLNFSTAEDYLERLEKMGLIRRGLGIIWTTESGLRLVKYFDKIDRFLLAEKTASVYAP